jgi:hypothetical protein
LAAKALVEIKQLFDPTQARPDIAEARRDPVHLLEECIREDVTVDVDDCFLCHGATWFNSSWPGLARPSTSSDHAKTWMPGQRRQVYAVCASLTALPGMTVVNCDSVS